MYRINDVPFSLHLHLQSGYRVFTGSFISLGAGWSGLCCTEDWGPWSFRLYPHANIAKNGDGPEWIIARPNVRPQKSRYLTKSFTDLLNYPSLGALDQQKGGVSAIRLVFSGPILQNIHVLHGRFSCTLDVSRLHHERSCGVVT